MSRKLAKSKQVQGRAARWGIEATMTAHWVVSKIYHASKHIAQGGTEQIKSGAGVPLICKNNSNESF